MSPSATQETTEVIFGDPSRATGSLLLHVVDAPGLAVPRTGPGSPIDWSVSDGTGRCQPEEVEVEDGPGHLGSLGLE